MMTKLVIRLWPDGNHILSQEKRDHLPNVPRVGDEVFVRVQAGEKHRWLVVTLVRWNYLEDEVDVFVKEKEET